MGVSKILPALAMLWTTATSTSIAEDTGVSLSLFVAGLGVTIALVWWARGVRDSTLKRLDRLERWRDERKKEDEK